MPRILNQLFGYRINYFQISLPSYQLLFILHLLISFISSCPEYCVPCINNNLSCDKTGLLEIPVVRNSHLKTVVVFQNQQFINPVLVSSNFSNYLSITDLSIRLCNINKIRPFTFSDLSHLRKVDLSENPELNIENNAFSNLNLQFLRLDNMGIIKLDLHAFNGLNVTSLSIQNSNLLSLPFELIDPISDSLTKLFLKNNQLKSLDVKLKPVLLGLQILELQENPFVCNCSLFWLSELLESKRQTMKAPMFENNEEIHPKCVSPDEFRKKYVHTLARNLKNCDPPTIIQIDVLFHTISTIGLQCHTKDQGNVNEHTEVGWFFPINNNKTSGVWKNSINVPLSSSLSKYKCKAQNTLGNAEINLFLTWSEIEKNNLFTENKTFTFENQARKPSFLWEKVFSLFEMMCAIFGTLVITVILFILFCCCYVERTKLLLMGKNKRKLQIKSYPSYERGVYTDSRIYCETDIDVCRFPPPPPPTPPPLPDTRLMPKNLFQSM